MAVEEQRWLLDGDGKAGRYGKMNVSGYSNSSWESSFDSQCLEIIRSRGGPGVATATANHRAKKNFSLYNAHFSVLVFAWAPSRNVRGSRRVGTGIDSDEGDEYNDGDESKEEVEWRSDGRRWR